MLKYGAYCYSFQKYPDQEELIRNMMGLLGNISEVKEFRLSHMMHDKFLQSLQ